MNEFGLYIRSVTPDDAQALSEIYGYYVKNTAVSFEYVPPTADEFRGRISHTLRNFPYIVAVNGERIIGYAYAREFVGREACQHCVEVSVYVARDCRRSGAGRALYEEMERLLFSMSTQASPIPTPRTNTSPTTAQNSTNGWATGRLPDSTGAAINSATGTTSSG